MSGELVLVTGASGFIASHVVQQLQQAGYKVRGTVRSLKNEHKVQPLRDLCSGAAYELELVEADLMEADCWKAAVEGCKYVIHVASPFVVEPSKPEDEVIKPAVDGTLNVLNAVKAAQCVKRVVLTSSVFAVYGEHAEAEKVYTEEDWPDVKAMLTPYGKSKVLAERAAWDFMKEITEEDEKFELCVVNPAYVVGPVLINTITASMEVPKRILNREMSMLPPLSLAIFDVRDVAAAHIAAMTATEAAGKRHILCAGNMWVKEVGQLYYDEFKDQGYNPPTSEAPYWLLWVIGRFAKSVRGMLPMLGKEVRFDATRMKTVLGIDPRPMKDSFIDMAYSMIERGMIKKTPKYRGPQSDQPKEATTEAESKEDQGAEGKEAVKTVEETAGGNEKPEDTPKPTNKEEPKPASAENTVTEPEEQKAEPGESKTDPEERKPEPGESKTDPEESKPEAEESKTESEESKPEPEQSKTEPEENKPEPEESKTEPEESKAEPEQSKTEPEESKPEAEQSKTEPEQSKPMPAKEE